MGFVDDAATIQEDLVALRRRLHARPEVGNDLPLTQAAVLEALDGLPLEITTGERVSSVVAVLRGRGPVAGERRTVLLRGDMDGLPVTEETGLDHAATTGTMHACGHDLHVAGLVGAARLLCARRDTLPGDVIFMFQPGEEGPGGALPMIEEGLLSVAGGAVDAAFAIHVFGMLERGVFTTRPGPMMAGSNQVHVTVHGRGGHGSMPYSSVDPVPVAAEIVLALQSYVTRRINVFDPVVITVGRVEAGTAVNVIPDTATLSATVRTLSTASREQLQRELPRLAEGIASAHGCTAEVEFIVGYPVTVNDGEAHRHTVAHLRELFGEERVVPMPEPLMGSEDFSYVLDRVPGTFVMLGARPADVAAEDAQANHSAKVVFDDGVLGDQAAALASLAASTLERLTAR
ncbi:M20 metallopeptidase family protein [Georgenia alba]|uniref:M20 family metallopeptidase n=1 Tax=Georgenia alba TaxID=2233858 RepID=A0ABW2QCH4_9MICO